MPSVLNPDRHPGVGLRLPAPRQALDRELVVAGPERRGVQRDAQMAVRVLREIVDDFDAALIDAVDRDAELVVGRARHVDYEIRELRLAAADDDRRRGGGALAAREQADRARRG